MSVDLLQKIALLLIAALISGIAVPLIMKVITARMEESKKRIESSRIRNQAITSSQAKLLEEFSEVALTYETLALDVSWFGCTDSANKELQKKAFDRYNEEIVDLHIRWRTLLIRSRLLTSGVTHQTMTDVFETTLVLQDSAIVRKYNDTVDSACWEIQHQTNQEVLTRVNDVIATLATDMKLTKSDLHGV